MAKTDSSISLELMDRWRIHAAALRQKLQDEPGNEWRWIWQVRLQIITYLLGRYAPVGASQTAMDHAPAPDESAEAVEAYHPVRVAGVPTVPPDMGRPPHASTVIRTHLESLADANRERTQEADRIRRELIADYEEVRRQIMEAWLLPQLTQPPRPAQETGPSVLCAIPIPERPVPELSPALPSLLDQRQLLAIASEALDEQQIMEILREASTRPG